jgi:hypothetical protein
MCVKRLRGAGACPLLVAFFVAISIGSGGARAEVSQKLKDGLTNESPKVRIVAAMGVAKTKDTTARTLLEPLLKDPDAAVRAAVVEALGRIGDPASVPAIEAIAKDSDETVLAVIKRVLPALKALQISVYIGDAKDVSNFGLPGMAEELRVKVKAEITKKLGPGYLIIDDASQKAYGANPIIIRSVAKTKDGGNSFLELKCEVTLVEMPQNILRAALASTAAVGVKGEIPKKLEPELARDALAACAPEIAGDFAAYVKERARR